MASRFWVGGAGTWDASDTTHWSATSGGAGGQTVPGSGDTVTVDASSGAGTITVNTTVNVTSLTFGAAGMTLDFSINNNNVTLVTCSGTGSGTRTLKMGSGTWTLTGNNATIWNFATVTNLTLVRGNPIVCNYSGSTGTRTISHSDTGETSNPSFSITAGTDIVAIGTRANSIDFTGFSGSLTNAARVLFGSLTLSATMTSATGATTTTFSATSGTQVLTTNGVTYGSNITVDGVGTTVSLGSDLTLDTSRIITITNGAFTANNNNVSITSLSCSNSNTRGLTLGSGTWTLSGTGTIWNTSTTTGLTFDAGTSTVKITDTSVTGITFTAGGLTFNNIWWSRGASTATNTLLGTNTFADFKDTGTAAHTIVFPNVTTTVSSFTVSGTVGNVITLARTGAAGTFTLSKASGTVSRDYLSISNSAATGGAAWYAGANSTDGGGNTGWIFSVPPATVINGGGGNSRMTSLGSLSNIARL